MEFRFQLISVLFALAVVGGYGYASALLASEDYWHSLWASPIPKALQDFVQPTDIDGHSKLKLELYKRSNAEAYDVNAPGEVDDTQFPQGCFFEQDLHQGKKFNLRFNMHSFAQPPAGVAWWQTGLHVDSKSLETKRFTINEICDNPAAVGVNKMCATSLESLVDFVVSRLGKEIQPTSSSFVPHQKQYKILEGMEMAGEVGVICHRLNFRKVVFLCHQVNKTRTYKVPLEAIDGTKTVVLANCHHDTRGMNAHLMYKELKVMPGTVPVCHFMSPKDIAWLPTKSQATY